jgi:hypothetical protein
LVARSAELQARADAHLLARARDRSPSKSPH